MIERNAFSIDFVQLAFFLRADQPFVSSTVVAFILQNFGKQFDGDMQVLPIPQSAPPELPRVLMQSNDGNTRFQAGPARCDLVVRTPSSVSDGAEVCRSVLAVYAEKSKIIVNRAAFIVSRYAEFENPAQSLISHFCNDQVKNGPLSRSATFEIHNHKEYSPGTLDYPVNSWVRCTCGKNEQTGSQVISVLQDINTAEDPQRHFSTDQLKEFLSVASEASEEILEKYFPLETK